MLKCLRESKKVRPCLGAAQSEYVNVIKILPEKGLVELRPTKPKVINGICAVLKKDKQRLIIDARNANGHFIECPFVVLPNAGNWWS